MCVPVTQLREQDHLRILLEQIGPHLQPGLPARLSKLRGKAVELAHPPQAKEVGGVIDKIMAGQRG